MTVEERALEEQPVLRNRDFLLLWLLQIAGQTAQYAILFTLLILVVDLTSSSTVTSLLVITYVFPSFVFGFFSGILVDRWSKRRILIATNIIRAVLVIAFLVGQRHLVVLFGVNLAFAAVSQFFTTTNMAAIPSVVPRKQLMAANSMFALALTGTQFAGMVFVAPILLKAAGVDALFLAAVLMFLTSAGLAWLLPSIGEQPAPNGRMEMRAAAADYLKALRMLRSDATASLALVHLTASSSLVLLFAVLVPRYMQAILHIPPDNAVLVFAPVGVGALIGLRLLPWMASRLGKTRIVAIGLLGLAIGLVALGMIETIAQVLQGTEHLNPFGRQRIGGLSILMSLTMLFAGPLGFTYAMVNAPAQTVLHESAPEELRGRIFAAQMVLANAVSLLPLILVGGIADVYGVSSVILAIAVAMALIAGATAVVEMQTAPRRTPIALVATTGLSGNGERPDAFVDTPRPEE